MAHIKCEGYWMFVTKVNEMSGVYQVDASKLDAEAIKVLDGLGLSKKIMDKGDERGKYITLKTQTAPRVVDSNKKAMPDTLIGNGSKIKVVVRPFTWTNKFGTGLGAGLGSVMVTDLVAYEGGDGLDELDVEEGYAGDVFESDNPEFDNDFEPVS